MRLSRFHLPILLRSTVVTRFSATMRTLTPVLLLPAPEQVSLVHRHALPDIPSPTTPCAPVFRQCFLLRAGLASDSPLWAITSSSDFAHHSLSHQSHQAVSSLCRSPRWAAVLRTIRSLPVALHPVSPRRSYFQLLAGSSARERPSLSCACLLPSARVRALLRRFQLPIRHPKVKKM